MVIKLKKKLYGILYIIFLLILTISFVLMPFGYTQKESSITLFYVAGGCFWLGMVGTIVSAIIFNIKENRKLSFIRFCKNKFATVTDIVMGVTLIGFIVLNELINNLILSFVLLGVFIFSLGLHCLFNSEEKEIKKRKERKR